MTLKQMKELAKAKIKGKIGILFLIMLVWKLNCLELQMSSLIEQQLKNILDVHMFCIQIMQMKFLITLMKIIL